MFNFITHWEQNITRYNVTNVEKQFVHSFLGSRSIKIVFGTCFGIHTHNSTNMPNLDHILNRANENEQKEKKKWQQQNKNKSLLC